MLKLDSIDDTSPRKLLRDGPYLYRLVKAANLFAIFSYFVCCLNCQSVFYLVLYSVCYCVLYTAFYSLSCSDAISLDIPLAILFYIGIEV